MPYPMAACRPKMQHVFSPLDIAGLQLWLRADAGTYQDAAMTTPAVADADPVGGWADQSGIGRHATQATDGKRPLLKLAIQNGKPVVRGDSADDVIAAPLAGLLLSAFTIAWALSIPAGATKGVWQWASTGAEIAVDPAVLLQRDTTLKVFVNGGYRWTLTHDTAFHTVILTYASNVWELFVDGVSQGTYAGGTLNKAIATYVYLNSGYNGYVGGDFGEHLIYNSALSAANRAKLEAYLNSAVRWAVY